MASFEESLTRLEEVVAKLEAGDLSLEQSVELYEQGVQLSESCKAELDKAEGRVQVLVRGNGGKLQVQEFQPGDEGQQ
jgi:exodeoxyribonuclease VII small subunit